MGFICKTRKIIHKESLTNKAKRKKENIKYKGISSAPRRNFGNLFVKETLDNQLS